MRRNCDAIHKKSILFSSQTIYRLSTLSPVVTSHQEGKAWFVNVSPFSRGDVRRTEGCLSCKNNINKKGSTTKNRKEITKYTKKNTTEIVLPSIKKV
jgi:hypothetical protein